MSELSLFNSWPENHHYPSRESIERQQAALLAIERGADPLNARYRWTRVMAKGWSRVSGKWVRTSDYLRALKKRREQSP